MRSERRSPPDPDDSALVVQLPGPVTATVGGSPLTLGGAHAPVAASSPVSTLESLAGGPVTIVFTDVEASTDLRTRRGDQAAQELLGRHEDLVRIQVRAHGGREVKALGDGFMLAFGSARRALACAVAIQRALWECRFDLPDVKVRIGLNTGEVVCQGEDLYGQAVHSAARIAAKAAGGQILVSEIVKQLVGATPDLTFIDRGRYRLKGFPERLRLFEVPWTDEEPAPSAQFAVRTPYVGREAERAGFVDLLDRAARGRGSLVLIGGEPGVGKTRLAEEVGAEAAAKGFRLLVGRCYETEGAPPYGPFVEILEQALAAAPSPEAFRAVLGDDAPEVAKLLPRLRRLFPDIPPGLELPPEQERRYLFNSLRDHLAREAGSRPLFLVLDDLHWADEGTLLLLEHLAEWLPRLAVVVAGTYRDTEVTPDHRFARPLEALLRRRLAQLVSLKRLSEAGVAALLQALGGQEPPASFVAAVHAETQGNPFFIEEVFKHLAEEGRLLGEDGLLRPDVAVGELDVPESLRLVLGRRLERLGENGRRALFAAAVVGRAFTYELLEALGELPPDDLLDALDEAERARLVAPLSDAPDEDRLLFAHELIRQTLLTGLSQPRRRRLHLRVADTLERLYATTLDEQASEIAHHLTQAGPVADHHRLLTYLARAGRQAMRTAGYEDALRHFEQAVAILDVAEPAERPELFANRALARRSLGRYEDALPDWEEALDGYERLRDREAAARMCFEASIELWWLNRDGQALALAKRGLAILGDQESAQRAQMLGWIGVTAAWIAPYEVGAESIDQAVALAERIGEKRLVGQGLVSRALHRFAFSLHRDVLEAGQEGIRLLRAQEDLWEVATLLGSMEIAALELGRIGLATELGQEVEALATRLGHSWALSVLHESARSTRQLMASPDLKVYEASAHRHLAVGGTMGYRHASEALLSHAAFLRGDWDEALRRAEEAVRNSPGPPNTTVGPEWSCYLRILAHCGRGADVLAVLDGAVELPRSGQPNGYGTWLLPSAAIEALSAVGERDRAARFYPLVEEYMSTTGVVLNTFPPQLVERIAGIGAAAGRQWDIAEAHFGTALRQAEELPFELEGAETRRWYARMLLDRNGAGDRERAESLVEEATPVYRRIGMPRHEDLARRLLSP